MCWRLTQLTSNGRSAFYSYTFSYACFIVPDTVKEMGGVEQCVYTLFDE